MAKIRFLRRFAANAYKKPGNNDYRHFRVLQFGDPYGN